MHTYIHSSLCAFKKKILSLLSPKYTENNLSTVIFRVSNSTVIKIQSFVILVKGRIYMYVVQ